jgi:hypothetical protein
VLQHSLFVAKTAVELIQQQRTHGSSLTSTESITSAKTGNISLSSQILVSHTYGGITQSIASNMLIASQTEPTIS